MGDGDSDSGSDIDDAPPLDSNQPGNGSGASFAPKTVRDCFEVKGVRTKQGKPGARCLLCGGVYSKPQRNSSNLKQHMMAKHPRKLREIQEARSGCSHEGNEDSTSNTPEEGMTTDDSPGQSPSTSATPQGSQTPHSSSGSSQPQRQATLEELGTGRAGHTGKGRTGQGTKLGERFCRAIAYFLAVCMLPYSLVESDGFRVLINTFAPGFSIPKRNAFADNYIPALYEKTKAAVKKVVQTATHVSLTSDLWTSRAKRSFMAVTAHFIDQSWELCSVCVGVFGMDKSHSGLNLRDALNNCLQTWGIVRSKVGCLTTDNGGNIVLAGRLLRLPHMACFDHTLTIGVDSIYKLPVVDAVLAKCKKIQTLFSISTTARREFRNIVSRMGKRAIIPPAACLTRWWSTLRLMEAILTQHVHLATFLETYQGGKSRDLILTPAERYVLHTVVTVLRPLKQTSDHMASERSVTTSGVLSVLREIEQQRADLQRKLESANAMEADDEDWDTLEQSVEVAGSEEEMNLASLPSNKRLEQSLQYLDMILEVLRERYDWNSRLGTEPLTDTEVKKAAVTRKKLLENCSFLDPRFTNELRAEERDAARERLIAEMAEVDGSADSSGSDASVANAAAPAAPSARPLTGFAAIFAKRRRAETEEPQTPEGIIAGEVERYCNAVKPTMESCPAALSPGGGNTRTCSPT